MLFVPSGLLSPACYEIGYVIPSYINYIWYFLASMDPWIFRMHLFYTHLRGGSAKMSDYYEPIGQQIHKE